MALKTALEHNPVLTIAFLLFGGWLAITTLNVASSMGSLTGTDWAGHTGPGGIVGLGVLFVLGVLVVYLYAELAESDPAPDSFPPER
jgi:hypothetical protein